MEENRYTDPREIVEVYRHPLPEEVVETYVRPLPVSMYYDDAWEEAAWYRLRRKRRRRNLLVFLLCLTAAVSLAAAAWVSREEEAMPPADRYVPQKKEITISAYPTDPDMSFRVSSFLYAVTEPIIQPIRKLCYKKNWFQHTPIDVPFMITMLLVILAQTILESL